MTDDGLCTTQQEIETTLLFWRRTLMPRIEIVMREVDSALSAWWERLCVVLPGLLRSLRRAQLHIMLRRYHVPGFLAGWVCRHCPERWLPGIDRDVWRSAVKQEV